MRKLKEKNTSSAMEREDVKRIFSNLGFGVILILMIALVSFLILLAVLFLI